jgi:hypothetical protein
MIEKVIIDGKRATVAFLKGNMIPCDQHDASFIKIIFDDGGTMFAIREDASKQDTIQ